MESILETATRLSADIKTFSEGQAFFLKQAEAFPSEAPKHRARAAAAGALVKIREQQAEELCGNCAEQISYSFDGKTPLIGFNLEQKVAAIEVIASAKAGHPVTVSGIRSDGDNIEVLYEVNYEKKAAGIVSRPGGGEGQRPTLPATHSSGR